MRRQSRSFLSCFNKESHNQNVNTLFGWNKKIYNVNRSKFEMVRIYFPQFDGFSRSQESLEGNEACLWLQPGKRKNNLINFWTFFQSVAKIFEGLKIVIGDFVERDCLTGWYFQLSLFKIKKCHWANLLLLLEILHLQEPLVGSFHFSKKTLAEMGGTPTPLNGKSAKLFWRICFLKGLKPLFLY